MAQAKLSSVGVHVPEILLPKSGIDMKKWSVVACDQYTSQPKYWEEVDNLVGTEPSTLRMILPEVYLETDKEEEIIKRVLQDMQSYVKDGILVPSQPGFILLERRTKHEPPRKGLVVALDLECYDYSKGSTTLIRATEGTIVARIPPRLKVREAASIETPHIMVLIDDPQETVIEPLFKLPLEVAYDTDLMCNGGHIKGWFVNKQEHLEQVADALLALSDPKSYSAKYNIPEQPVLLFAMGDGNHSLATAKAHWEKIKSVTDAQAQSSHPARYALVELVNIHDAALQFEPIHRILFHTSNVESLNKGMSEYYGSEEFGFVKVESIEQAKHKVEELRNSKEHAWTLVSKEGIFVQYLSKPKLNLEVASLQGFLDPFIQRSGSKIDYVHGDDVVLDLGTKDGNLGFLLPDVPKNGFFRSIICDGVLPRKTFSMGEADEKRYYTECRRIVP